MGEELESGGKFAMKMQFSLITGIPVSRKIKIKVINY